MLEETLSTSRREVRASTVAVIFLVLCLAAFVSVFTYFFASKGEQTKNQLKRDAFAAAQVVSTNMQWVNQLAVQTLRRVDAQMGPEVALWDKLAFDLAADTRPFGTEVNFIAADGKLLFSTDKGLGGIRVDDREYFTKVRDGAPFYISGNIISRPHNISVFVFSKRVSRNGRFAGVVTVSYLNNILDPIAMTLDLPHGSSIAVYRDDGQLVARYPTVDVPQDKTAPLAQLAGQMRQGTVFIESSVVDEQAKVLGYELATGTQLTSVVAMPTEPAWMAYRRELGSLFVVVSPGFIALLVLGGWIAHLLIRDAERRAQLEAANETNLMLFREIHHRVKNNLQSVQSLVRLQDIPQSAKVDLQSRLSAMAAMHEHIYRHDVYKEIDAHELIPVVIDEVIKAYGVAVEVVYDVDTVFVDRDHITPLSLLLSELVTNALKYAFQTKGRGIIKIILRDHHNGRCQLIVTDNGVGFDMSTVSRGTMGIRLIAGVVAQMGGTYEFLPGGGTRFEANLALSAKGHHSNRSQEH